jgi:4-hydroxybenzoate polyprenyltransferase
MSQPGASSPRPPLPLALLIALRPRQWTKNLVVLAPLIFAKSATASGPLRASLLAFAAFCLAASGIYLLNDWVDRDRDRLHPEKRERPIAAGWVSLRHVAPLALLCWGSAFALSAAVHLELVGFIAGYLTLQLLYSFALKQHVILDVMVISLGFILRVQGGSSAIGVHASNWIYLCTLLLAVSLGFAKRRAELALLEGEGLAHRANLGEYSLPMLDQMMSVVGAACIVSYSLYTVSKETIDHVGSDGLKLTVPFVIYGIFRYLYLVHRRNAGGSPERVLLSDPPLIIDLLLFVGVAGWVLYR